MINFDFKRTSRKCSNTGRSFQSGEEYISLLIDEAGEFIRKDITADEFDQPPEDCIAWWKSRVPDLEKGNVYWAPKDVLMSYFQHIVEQTTAKDLSYVLAILLLQKKHLRLLDTEEADGVETMTMVCNSSKQKFEIETVDISPERVAAIQDDLAEKLFTDIAPSDD